jgi:DNA-binding NarL/FixJ family response regulator
MAVMKVDSPASEAPAFTTRQLKVIYLLLQGKSNKQIALQLGTCTRTVEEHLTHIYQKLKISSRAEAIIKLIGLSEESQSSGIRS